MDNEIIARDLLRLAREKAAAGDNLFRVRAYRRAALVVQGMPRPVRDVLAVEGVRGLRRIPGVGASLATTIAELAKAG